MRLLIISVISLMFSTNAVSQTFTLGDCSTAANSQNAYDAIGAQHNTTLEYLMNNLTEKQRLNIPSAINTSAEFVEKQFGLTIESGTDLESSTLGLENLYSKINNPEGPSKEDFLDVINISKIAKNHLDIFLTDIYNSQDLDFQVFKAKAVKWESQIEMLNLSDNEKKALYSFGSTIRYSYLGWLNVNKNKTELSGNKFRLRLFGWIVTAVADAVGAVIGALGSGGTAAVIIGAVGSGMAAGVGSHNGW